MFRGRVLIVVLLALAGVGASLASARTDGHFRYTHRATLVSTYVDRWTVNDRFSCGLVGEGSVTVSIRFSRRVHLYYDKFAGKGGDLFGAGNWVVGVPGGAGATQASHQPATGTITLVDNTTQNPPDDGETCTHPKTDCGSTPLAKATINLVGYDLHRLLFDLPKTRFNLKAGSGRQVRCGIGQTRYFSDPEFTGRAADGEQVIPMASPATVAHRRVVKVTGSFHRKRSSTDCGDAQTCSDDVTRSVTVTFKKL